jgi:hypothetical protein
MQKIVINTRHGGFGLSAEAMSLYREFCLEAGAPCEDYDDYIPRDNPQLISVVQALGESASGPYAQLKIVEVPDDVEWTIHEYDGSEWVAEAHRTWS